MKVRKRAKFLGRMLAAYLYPTPCPMPQGLMFVHPENTVFDALIGVDPGAPEGDSAVLFRGELGRFTEITFTQRAVLRGGLAGERG